MHPDPRVEMDRLIDVLCMVVLMSRDSGSAQEVREGSKWTRAQHKEAKNSSRWTYLTQRREAVDYRQSCQS